MHFTWKPRIAPYHLHGMLETYIKLILFVKSSLNTLYKEEERKRYTPKPETILNPTNPLSFICAFDVFVMLSICAFHEVVVFACAMAFSFFILRSWMRFVCTFVKFTVFVAIHFRLALTSIAYLFFLFRIHCCHRFLSMHKFPLCMSCVVECLLSDFYDKIEYYWMWLTQIDKVLKNMWKIENNRKLKLHFLRFIHSFYLNVICETNFLVVFLKQMTF